MRILITGHTGFVGRALVSALSDNELILVGRRSFNGQQGIFFKKQLTSIEDYHDCLDGVSVVIHSAARVHLMTDNSSDPLAAYREVNFAGTINLARQAAAAGVKRFIFISTIKVNGEKTSSGHAFTVFDQPNPIDPYSISKFEAEQELRRLCAETGMEYVIIRPPLVYGAGVKANFAEMLRLAKKNLPLPLGAIHNKRSMVALDNLVDLIKTCITHPLAMNQVFLVSDDYDLSTTELLKVIMRAYGKTDRLLPIPMSWFNFLGKLTGKKAVISRLCSNLQVDITHTKQTLDWNPPVSVELAIKSAIDRQDSC